MKNCGVRSDLFRLKIKILDDYDKKYMQIKFNLDDKSRLKDDRNSEHDNSCSRK